MSQETKFALNVWGCWIHAALLSFTIWISPSLGWGYLERVPTIWIIGLVVWPLWAYSFWKGGERKLWKIIGPILCGVIFMVPGFLILLVLYAMNHAKSI